MSSGFRAAFVTLSITLAALGVTRAQPESAPSAEAIFEAIGVHDGATVCEIGAGSGTLSIAAAKRVGAGGRVLTSELGESRLQRLRAAVDASGLSNITVVAGDAERTNLADSACDALFMRDVYHHFTSPGPMNASIHAALKPGARLAIVDFMPPGEEAAAGSRAVNGSHGVYPETVGGEMKAAGFEVISSTRGSRWFMVVLSKPRS